MNVIDAHNYASEEVTLEQRIASLDPVECAQYIDECLEKAVKAEDAPNLDLIMARAAIDTQFFGRCYMSETYDEPMTHQHEDQWRVIDDDTVPYAVICGWRGFGKTTATITKAVKSICYRDQNFICIVGKSYTYSSGITESIKNELLMNPRIRYCFGSLKAKKYEDADPSFSKESWFACDPVSGEPFSFVVPKGCEQAVRGMVARIGGALRRPSLIIVDDLEDDKEVLNEDRRRETQNWFEGALLHCVNRKRPNPRTKRWRRPDKGSKEYKTWKPPWRIIVNDTLKHHDALIAHLFQDDAWLQRRYPQAEYRDTGLLDANGKAKMELFSLVPELISDEQVRTEANRAQANNKFDVYCREKLCLPTSPVNAAWTKDMFKYFSDARIMFDGKPRGLSHNPDARRFIIVDPAKTANPRNAMTAILGVAAVPQLAAIYFRDLVCRHLEAKDIYRLTIDMAVALNTMRVCVEVTGLEDHVKYGFETEVAKRGLMGKIEFCWLKAQSTPRDGDYGTGKEAIKRARASQILPYYQVFDGKGGHVYHEDSLRDSPLEQQMLSYPNPAKWDGLDVAGYVPQVLRDDGFYFAPLTIEKADQEFAQSDYNHEWFGEQIAAGDWRVC